MTAGFLVTTTNRFDRELKKLAARHDSLIAAANTQSKNSKRSRQTTAIPKPASRKSATNRQKPEDQLSQIRSSAAKRPTASIPGC